MSKHLGGALVTVALLAAMIGGVGAPLITAVATTLGASLGAAQWTLTVTLFTGAIAAPVLGRLGAGPRRRAAILTTLALVTLGGLLTTLPLGSGVAPGSGAPLGLGALLVGRGLQGLGLGATALLMSVARDHLPAQRAPRTIGMLAVASTVGIGVSYPLIGLVDQLAGLRAAYGVGLLLSAAALALAALVLPPDPPHVDPSRPPARVDPSRPPARVDLPGAVLLGVGTLALLLVVAEPAVWRGPWGWPGPGRWHGPAVGVGVALVAVVALAAWVAVESRTAAPLVELRLLVRPTALRANLAMLVAGVGLYLLFSLLTRLVQTPSTVDYGFGLPGVLAGAALIPFSVLGFVAGRLAPAALARVSPRTAYAATAVTAMLAAVILAAWPASLVAVLVAMAVLGFGVGGVSALMPRLVLVDVPSPETASVLSINQIVRSIGFSIGSALAGVLLAASTPAGALLPTERGYRVAALWALPLLALSLAALRWPRRPAPASQS